MAPGTAARLNAPARFRSRRDDEGIDFDAVGDGAGFVRVPSPSMDGMVADPPSERSLNHGE